MDFPQETKQNILTIPERFRNTVCSGNRLWCFGNFLGHTVTARLLMHDQMKNCVKQTPTPCTDLSISLSSILRTHFFMNIVNVECRHAGLK